MRRDRGNLAILTSRYRYLSDRNVPGRGCQMAAVKTKQEKNSFNLESFSVDLNCFVILARLKI